MAKSNIKIDITADDNASKKLKNLDDQVSKTGDGIGKLGKAAAIGGAAIVALGGIARAGTAPIYFDIKPTNAARSATNPSFVGAAYISKWSPVGGNVGDKAGAQLTLTITGTFTDLVA